MSHPGGVGRWRICRCGQPLIAKEARVAHFSVIDAAAKLALLRAVLCRKELCLGGLGSVAASRARSARGSSPVTVSATVGVRARAAAPCGARAAGAQRYALLLVTAGHIYPKHRSGASFGHAATRFPNARFPVQSAARALVLLRVRGQVERQWAHQPSHHPEGQVQRMFWDRTVY